MTGEEKKLNPVAQWANALQFSVAQPKILLGNA